MGYFCRCIEGSSGGGVIATFKFIREIKQKPSSEAEETEVQLNAEANLDIEEDDSET